MYRIPGIGIVRARDFTRNFGNGAWYFHILEDGKLDFRYGDWTSPGEIVFLTKTKVSLEGWSLPLKNPFRNKKTLPIPPGETYRGVAWSPLFGDVILDGERLYPKNKDNDRLFYDASPIIDDEFLETGSEWGVNARRYLKETPDFPLFFTKQFEPIIVTG